MMYPTKKIAFLGLMLALILILVTIEGMLPPLPMLPPQFGRVGLSNVIVMYVLFFWGKKEAVTMVILKALFNTLMRGFLAGLLSLSGGLLSIIFIIIFYQIFKEKTSYISFSISGAIGHNMGQLAVACLILQSHLLFISYFPILLISGAVFGTVTGLFLKVLIPIMVSIAGDSYE